MTNNETTVNGNTTDDEIIKELEFGIVDLDDPKNNDIKSYVDGDIDEMRWNCLIGNDWVIYSNGYEYEKKPVFIKNGVRIIKWIWRYFSIFSPSGFFNIPYDLHNSIRFKHRIGVVSADVPGVHLDILSNLEYQDFINYAFLDGKIWAADSHFRRWHKISFRSIPYFTQCFSFIQDVWVVKNNDIKLIDFASVFYCLYLKYKYRKRTADLGIARLKEIREVYYGKQ